MVRFLCYACRDDILQHRIAPKFVITTETCDPRLSHRRPGSLCIHRESGWSGDARSRFAPACLERKCSNMSTWFGRSRSAELRLDSGHTPATPAAAPADSESPATRRNLCAMTWDGLFYSLMVGAGETYVPAFVLEAGLGELAAGLITTLPLLAGAMFQMLAPHGVRWLGSHRKWVIASVGIQATCFVPLACAAAAGGIGLFSVFLIAACYWGAGMAANAAWTSWAETLVPRNIRARYFSRRTRFTQLGTLLGIVGAGLLIQKSREAGAGLMAFAVIFTVAAVCRYISTWSLTLHGEPEPLPNGQRSVSAGELYRRIVAGGNERLLLYLVLMQFAVYFSGPYFTPYMLRKLELSYTTYVWLIASCFAAKMLALPLWGRVAHKAGAQQLLWIGGIGVIPISAMWLVSTSLPYLFFLQISGGIVWAAYELAMLLLFFETLKREERTALMTMYNVGNAVAMAIGSILGGLLLSYLGKTPNAYLTLFLLSSVFRVLTVGVLWSLPKLQATDTVPSPETAVPEPLPVPAVAVERTAILPSKLEEIRAPKAQPRQALAN